MKPIKFLGLAEAVAALSKDPSTKVAAIVVDEDGTILSAGFNGFPRGVSDDPARYADRETKLQLTAHAESNAIAQAARNGVRLKGATMVVTALYPCSSCAKQIIQAGIRRVLAPRMDPAAANPQWFREQEVSELLFREAGVTVEFYDAQP